MIITDGAKTGTAARRAYELLRFGSAEYDVIRTLMQDYALSPAEAENAIVAAYGFLRERMVLRSNEDKRNLSVAQLEQLAADSVRQGKLHIALQAYNARDRLLGLHEDREKEKPKVPQTLLEIIKLEQKENAEASALAQKQKSEAQQNDGNSSNTAARSGSVLQIGSGGESVAEAD